TNEITRVRLKPPDRPCPEHPTDLVEELVSLRGHVQATVRFEHAPNQIEPCVAGKALQQAKARLETFTAKTSAIPRLEDHTASSAVGEPCDRTDENKRAPRVLWVLCTFACSGDDLGDDPLAHCQRLGLGKV